MPIYEYQCRRCKNVFELLHKMDEDCKAVCPKCMAPARKLISATNFVLTRSGSTQSLERGAIEKPKKVKPPERTIRKPRERRPVEKQIEKLKEPRPSEKDIERQRERKLPEEKGEKPK